VTASFQATRRTYFTFGAGGGGGGGLALEFDPRFLVFEFVWNLLLRPKQVEIVERFVREVRRGGSRVRQMIMGAGKTTVVAPLLALILGNNQTLVMQVMPSRAPPPQRRQRHRRRHNKHRWSRRRCSNSPAR